MRIKLYYDFTTTLNRNKNCSYFLNMIADDLYSSFSYCLRLLCPFYFDNFELNKTYSLFLL